MNEFEKNRYVIVKDAIPNDLRDFVTQYALFDEMQDLQLESQIGAGAQVPNAHSKYADPAMESMLLYLHPIMEKHTGLKLHPTYSYYRVYRNGDDLKPHIDRPSCEISATVCFNYGYDDTKYQWPIFIEGTPAILSPGDMVIYHGQELSHWREELFYPEDTWQVQGFFHFVDADGVNANFKWDKRNSIGESNSKNIKLIDNRPQKSYIKWL